MNESKMKGIKIKDVKSRTYSSSNMRRRWTASMATSVASPMATLWVEKDTLALREENVQGRGRRREERRWEPAMGPRLKEGESLDVEEQGLNSREPRINDICNRQSNCACGMPITRTHILSWFGCKIGGRKRWKQKI